jgi:hypothetical protein
VSKICAEVPRKDISSDVWTVAGADGTSSGDLSIREINKIKSSGRNTLQVFLKKRSSFIQ